MEAIMNQMRRAAHEAMGSRAVTRHGLVSGYDPSTYAVKVELQPDGTLTGWIPLKSICAGNGWGIYCPPALGTAVEVDFQEADGGAGSAGLSFYSDLTRPLSVPAGEFWLVHKSGASIKLTNAGAIALADGKGAAITLPGDGTITSVGNWTHSGTFTADGISLTAHVHKNVATGASLSGGPQ